MVVVSIVWIVIIQDVVNMIKYKNSVYGRFNNEPAIYIYCENCYSLKTDNNLGDELLFKTVHDLIEDKPDTKCICFVGIDSDLDDLWDLTFILQHFKSGIQLVWDYQKDTLPVTELSIENLLRGIPFNYVMLNEDNKSVLYKIDKETNKAIKI